MASKAPKGMPILPRDMRPRSTPNAELNAQERDKFLYDYYGKEPPEVKDVPLRGYETGGPIRTRRGMKGVGGGREMIAGAIGDQLGNRLKQRYE